MACGENHTGIITSDGKVNRLIPHNGPESQYIEAVTMPLTHALLYAYLTQLYTFGSSAHGMLGPAK